MKRLTTLICCLAFMVAGISLAINGNTNVLTKSTISAATVYTMPKYNVDQMQMPLDLLLDQAKKAGLEEATTLKEPEVTKVDTCRIEVPVVVERTVEVPVLYIATPADNKGDPPDDTPMYSVHKLDGGAIGITIPSSLDVESYEELVPLAYLRNLLDPRICLPVQQVRNSKGRMEDRQCEKLVDIRESVVSTLTLMYTSTVLYAVAILEEEWDISKENAENKPNGDYPLVAPNEPYR